MPPHSTTPRTCSYLECSRPFYARNYCGLHYRRQHRYGDPGPPPRFRVEERFWEKVNKHGPLWNGTPCWVWIGSRRRRGYGQVTIGGKRMGAHRVAYEFLRGSIPDGLTIDHLCRNPPCVNPGHTEPVTNRINTLRGDTVTSRNASKTFCPHGHPYNLLNTRIGPDGSRLCRPCQASWQRRYRVRQKLSS
jgi:hypothetical protein